MNDKIHLDNICELLDINNVPYRVSKIYDEYHQAYNAILLDTGHFEFDSNDILSNVVSY